MFGLDHYECLEKLSVTSRSPQQTRKGLSKLSISADLSNTRIMLSMKKLCYGFNCSLHTMLGAHPAPFTDVCLSSINCRLLVLGEMLQFFRGEQGRDTAGSWGASMNCFVIKWVSYLLAKEAGEACRAIILPDGPDLTQLLLLCKLGAFSPMVIIYCLKLLWVLWSHSQDVAIEVVILRDKLRHKRKKLRWIRQWWRPSSFHWAFIVILTSIQVLHFNFCLLRKKL